MAPAVVIDNTADFDAMDVSVPNKTASSSTPRTLLLAPPSVASHPDALSQVAAAYDRNATDIQMLDRLAMGLVSLPEETYEVVLILTEVDQSRQESSQLLDRVVMERIVQSLKPGGRLKSQDGGFGRTSGAEQTEAILAGLVVEGDGMTKPVPQAAQTVTLSFGKRKKANAAAVPLNGIEAANTAKRKSENISTGTGSLAVGNADGIIRSTPAGVGFVDSNDDFDGGFDDGSGYDEDGDDYFPSNEELQNAEKIDPDTLLTEEDKQKPLNIRKPCLKSV